VTQPPDRATQRQWYLCQIIAYPAHEGSDLKPRNNLSVRHPDFFLDGLNAMLMGEQAVERNAEGSGDWFVWLPIIPRVGDTLQFAGWQVEVSRIILQADWDSRDGKMQEPTVSACIHIRDNVVPHLNDAHFSVEGATGKGSHKWESFARRGHDLEYYAWELLHDEFKYTGTGVNPGETTTGWLRWHTRVRPVTGDFITVRGKRWRVRGVALTSADKSFDGWLTLEAVAP